jgi:hypothetical protein
MKFLKLIGRYFLNILIGIDQLINAILAGDPDECLSSRIGKYSRGTFLESVVDFIFGSGHCQKSIENDEGKYDVWKW